MSVAMKIFDDLKDNDDAGEEAYSLMIKALMIERNFGREERNKPKTGRFEAYDLYDEACSNGIFHHWKFPDTLDCRNDSRVITQIAVRQCLLDLSKRYDYLL